jgi:hypothetical protein
MVEEFTKSQLCYAGNGEQVHIRKGNRTYCGRGKLSNLKWPGLIGMTEKAQELCRSCLRAFKARE